MRKKGEVSSWTKGGGGESPTKTYFDITMAYPQRLMQTPYHARQLLQHAPCEVERQNAARRPRYELLERDRRAEALFDEVEVTWCTDRLEDLL